MKKITGETFRGERPLFASQDLLVENTVFGEGESPLKESSNIEVDGCTFEWKYPLWYCKDIHVKNTTWREMARAGVWYTDRISVEDCLIEAPKNFRRCNDLRLLNVTLPNAAETLWQCNNVTLEKVSAAGDYLAMNCSNIRVSDLKLDGNYSFDGARNVLVENSELMSKDAFWNSENVTVRNCYINGEYLGWNAKNLTFIDCTIESLQGMCYIDNLVMKNCKLINTTLAFEYSTVDAQISSKIDSVLNPTGGIIRAQSIDSLILDKDRIDPEKTRIIVEEN
ncbi:MAG: DUF3737 family protein [Lachnospiraceae bacterium]|nr:DUF3737 family protein [Lachnospiraceae bacterium]